MLLIGLALALAGCFGGSEEQPADEVVRTPRPTFTPTPKQPTPTPVPVTPTAPPANTGGATNAGQPLAIAADAPVAVVNSDQVNARKAANITSDNIIQELGPGTELRIIGKSADDEWWYVCCVDGATAWVYYSYVDVSGPVENVPVSEAIGGVAGSLPAQAAAPAATQPPTADPPTAEPPTAAPPTALPTDTPPPAPVEEQPTAPVEVAQPLPPTDTPAPAEPTATPAPAFPFNLVAQEQFVETNNLVRIFAYVYQGNTALPGYTLRVTKDGGDLPVSATSSDAAGFTWPVANPRQRFQNMKVEFPNVQVGGTWEIQLLDSGGSAAGPAATFTLTGDDQNRELYVRYEKP